MPPFTIQPLRLPRLPCSLPGTHHSSFPWLPSSSSCHLIQITELASVSFVWGSVLPGRWTGEEEMDSHRGEYVHVCVWDWRRERQEERREAETFLGGKMSNSNEVRRLLSVKPVWGLAFQAPEWQGCSLKRAGMRKWWRQNEFTSHSPSCHTVSALSVYALFYPSQCVISKKAFFFFGLSEQFQKSEINHPENVWDW